MDARLIGFLVCVTPVTAPGNRSRRLWVIPAPQNCAYDRKMPPDAARRSDRSRRAILVAALELLEALGYSRLTIEAVAARLARASRSAEAVDGASGRSWDVSAYLMEPEEGGDGRIIVVGGGARVGAGAGCATGSGGGGGGGFVSPFFPTTVGVPAAQFRYT